MLRWWEGAAKGLRRTVPFCLAILVCGAGTALAQIRDTPGTRPSPGNPVFSGPGEQPTSNQFFRQGPVGQDETFQIGGALEMEHHLDNVRPSGQRSFTNFSLEYEGSVFLNITRYVTINAVFKLEQVRDNQGDGFLRDHAAWIDQLYMSIHLGPVTVYGGKIHPRFGFAWDIAPGIYGTDFAEDYELVEQLGFGAVWRLPIDYGRHDLSAEWFRADTSILTNSAFTRTLPGQDNASRFSRLFRSDGGLGNSDGPSYSFALVGRDIPVPEGLGTVAYQLSYARLAPGVTETRPQHGFSAGFAWEIPITRRISITPIFEYAGFSGADGLDQRRNYTTFGAELVYYAWALSASTTLRDTSTPDARTNDYMVTMTLGYDLSQLTRINGLSAAVGWRRSREDGQLANTFGAEVVYGFRF